MKPNDEFKKVIKAYLDQRAKEDKLFAETYAKPNKNIDGCVNYILGEVRKNGSSVALPKDAVYSMAVHYYDEDDIKAGKPGKGLQKFAMTTDESLPPVELKPEELEKARLAAIKRAEEEAYRKVTAKRPKAKKSDESVNQMSLF